MKTRTLTLYLEEPDGKGGLATCSHRVTESELLRLWCGVGSALEQIYIDLTRELDEAMKAKKK